MRDTGPVYGIVQWVREPKTTWLARSLAIEHGYSLYESLRAAQHQIRNRSRREAIAGTVAEYIRSEHQDERLAKIAETTYDPDRLAGMLEERINYEVITNKLTKAISPPPEPEERPAVPAAVWVLEGGQPRRADGTGVGLRDDDAWTGELMAIVDQPPEGDESVAEAVVVEDAGEPEHVVNGKLKPFAPQPKAEPMVEKPKPPSPFADTSDTQPPALITTPKVEPVLPDPAPVVVAQSEPEPEPDQPEPTDLEKKRMRAWNMLADWPEGHERTAANLARAVSCSEPMAKRFIEQYETEHGLVFSSQN
jgi:hypothetical protein